MTCRRPTDTRREQASKEVDAPYTVDKNKPPNGCTHKCSAGGVRVERALVRRPLACRDVLIGDQLAHREEEIEKLVSKAAEHKSEKHNPKTK